MKSRTKNYNLMMVSALALIAAMPFSGLAHAQSVETAQPAPVAEKMALHPWGIENVDLTPDTAIRYGALPNGMKYAIRKNETPKGSAAVRMHVAVGSVAEAENERGLAHFLEHMAFNGSKNVPEGEMIKLLEREGLKFGADTNAYTSWNETVYQLDLPKTDDKTVDTALLLMRETGSNLTIAPAAVERERGVVVSEMQFRNSPQLKQAMNSLKFGLPDTPLSERGPIGLEEVLKTAPAARIADFYRRYYRPENVHLVVVGDFDVNAMETKIKAQFGDWKGEGPAGKPMDFGKVDAARTPDVGTFSDPSLPETVEFNRLTPYAQDSNSKASAKKNLLKALAGQIMGQRLNKLSLSKDTPILGGALNFSPVFTVADQSSFSVIGKDGSWKEALATGEKELRKALQFGFTKSELTEQLANIETALTNAAAQQNTRPTSQIADAITGSVYTKEMMTLPADNLAVFKSMKPQITLDALNEAFRAAWAPAPQLLYVTTKEPIAEPEKTIAAIMEDSMKVELAAPVEEVVKAFAYDKFGKPGKVKQDTQIADLGIRTIVFQNGVRLNIKKTDFEAGKIRYNLRVGNGKLILPQSAPGADFFMENMMGIGGTQAHSYEELEKITAGKSVSFGIKANDDSFGARGTTTPADAALQMKILAAYVTAPGYRPEADSAWQNAVPTIAAQVKSQALGVAQAEAPRVLANGDVRFGIADSSDLMKRNMAELKTLIADDLAKGAIEISLVGDLDEKAAIDMVANTFGALPKRPLQNKPLLVERMVKLPVNTAPFTLYHNGVADQGLVLAVWPTTDDKDQKSAVTRDIMASILSTLLLDEIREKLGASYSTQGISTASQVNPDYGFVLNFAIADPAKMDQIYAAIAEVTKTLRDAPVSEDVLLRARKPMLEAMVKQDRENGTWLTTISTAQSKAERLDRWRQRKAIMESITVADIQKTAARYLNDASMIKINIISKNLKK
jgi:zinc protease